MISHGRTFEAVSCSSCFTLSTRNTPRSSPMQLCLPRYSGKCDWSRPYLDSHSGRLHWGCGRLDCRQASHPHRWRQWPCSPCSGCTWHGWCLRVSLAFTAIPWLRISWGRPSSCAAIALWAFPCGHQSSHPRMRWSSWCSSGWVWIGCWRDTCPRLRCCG